MLRCAVAAALLLVAGVSGATTVRWLTHAELIARAERVVVGRVESRVGFWRGTRILTRHRVAVESTWRGDALPMVDVLTLGGVVGEIGQYVAGAARLRVGDRVVLYLVADSAGDNWVVGMAQGVFRIEAAAPGGERPLLRTDGARGVGPRPELPATLEALEREVRGAP